MFRQHFITDPSKVRLTTFLALAAALFVGRLPVSADPDPDAGKTPTHSETVAPAESTITQLDYVLQPSDLIRVVIFQEPDFEREVRLSGDSKIKLPYLDPIDLKGKTLQQAQQLIRDLYDRDILVNPQVNVTVLEYSKQTVNVLGAVNNPGPVNIPPDRPLTLLDAITRAGGFSRLANRKRVQVTRQTDDHRTVTTTINADDIIESNNTNQQILQKGDVINVPERIL